LPPRIAIVPVLFFFKHIEAITRGKVAEVFWITEGLEASALSSRVDYSAAAAFQIVSLDQHHAALLKKISPGGAGRNRC
jgi:hypothetical protein